MLDMLVIVSYRFSIQRISLTGIFLETLTTCVTFSLFELALTLS